MPRNSYFQFKQFRIIQERSAMKVGMDGVLVGAWTDTSGAKQILDVGTGTGLIALMMAQKNSQAQVDAIEIDEEAFQEAKLNVHNSPWRNRMKLELCSFQEFAQSKNQKYDLIISNPPFFTSGEKAPAPNRAQARHSDVLPLDILVSGAAKMLNANGRIALVLPAENLSEVETLASKNGLFVARLCHIKPNPRKPVFRILVELSNVESPKIEENLMIEFENHHDYTPEYQNLTSEFYLKF